MALSKLADPGTNASRFSVWLLHGAEFNALMFDSTDVGGRHRNMVRGVVLLHSSADRHSDIRENLVYPIDGYQVLRACGEDYHDVPQRS